MLNDMFFCKLQGSMELNESSSVQPDLSIFSEFIHLKKKNDQSDLQPRLA